MGISMASLFAITEEYPSQAYVTLLDDGPYAGRLADDSGVVFFDLVGVGMEHIPLYAVKTYFDDLVSIILDEIRVGQTAGFYLMGGAVSSSSDRMDSLGPLRRGAALARGTLAPSVVTGTGNAELYERFYELVWRDTNNTEEADFPGIFCHNHAGNEAMGPLKTNWSKPCPTVLEATQAEREEICISQ